MRLIISLALLLAATCQAAFAQTPRAKNAVYAELSGWALPSVNFERVIWQSPGRALAFRTGFMFVPGRTPTFFGAFPARPTANWIVPIGLNYLMGKGRNQLELGVQYYYIQRQGLEGNRTARRLDPLDPNSPYVPVTDNSTFETWSHHLLNFRVGYRYQTPEGGFTFRAGITPVNWLAQNRESFYLGLGRFLPYSTRSLVVFPMPDLSLGWSF
jgi:hypothetical protein